MALGSGARTEGELASLAADLMLFRLANFRRVGDLDRLAGLGRLADLGRLDERERFAERERLPTGFEALADLARLPDLARFAGAAGLSIRKSSRLAPALIAAVIHRG